VNEAWEDIRRRAENEFVVFMPLAFFWQGYLWMNVSS
jgi:hypothetical protein